MRRVPSLEGMDLTEFCEASEQEHPMEVGFTNGPTPSDRRLLAMEPRESRRVR